MQKLTIVLALIALTSALPQWPYRDNMEYYGYQRNAYRSVGSSAEDDSVEAYKGRQDLKVGGQQPPETSVVTNTAAAATPVVVETGSAKPVLNSAAAEPNKAAVAPVVSETVPAVANKQPPAFPPATPPSPPTPTEEDSEEDSDEDEEADEDDVENDDGEEEDEEENEARSEVKEIVPTITKPVTKVTNEKKPVKPVKKQQTVEALVPGYVTDEGEVLVPFDTVVNDKKDVVAVIEDPTYQKSSPPVVVMPTEPAKDDRPVPKFFNPAVNRQLYYSDVPPPGSIFTFDDDQEENSVVRGRADETSSEEAYDEETSDESAQDDDASEEEEKPKRPPLAYIKATAPSGEDDESDSLALRPIARTSLVDSRYYDYYPDRSPNYYYGGNNFYIPRYGNRFENRDSYKPTPIYYYRPASSSKVKVVPLGTFDVSIEQSEDDFRAVVSPFRYYGNRRPVQVAPQVRPQVVRRTQVVRRPSNHRVVYGTPVVRGRGKARREAKEMKKVKKVVKDFKKKVVKN